MKPKKHRRKLRPPNRPRAEVRFLVEPATPARVAIAKAGGDAFVAKVDSKRRFTIPKAVRDIYDVHPSDEYRFEVSSGDVILIFPARCLVRPVSKSNARKTAALPPVDFAKKESSARLQEKTAISICRLAQGREEAMKAIRADRAGKVKYREVPELEAGDYWPHPTKPIERPGHRRYEYLKRKHGGSDDNAAIKISGVPKRTSGVLPARGKVAKAGKTLTPDKFEKLWQRRAKLDKATADEVRRNIQRSRRVERLS